MPSNEHGFRHYKSRKPKKISGLLMYAGLWRRSNGDRLIIAAPSKGILERNWADVTGIKSMNEAFCKDAFMCEAKK